MTDSTQTTSPFDELSDEHRDLLQRMGESVGKSPEEIRSADDLIGYFQSFRPDGRGLAGVFSGVAGGDEVHERLERLFDVAGDDRRPSGGKDAFFVVRNPAEIDPAEVEAAGNEWIEQLKRLGETLGKLNAVEKLAGIERVRVLEGIPPKHPKIAAEKTDLLVLLDEEIPKWLEDAAPDHRIASSLRSPFYFVNCDAMLRDYLMWPMYRRGGIGTRVDDPFSPYFRLWRHGVKWRVFQETQVDLYMPRR